MNDYFNLVLIIKDTYDIDNGTSYLRCTLDMSYNYMFILRESKYKVLIKIHHSYDLVLIIKDAYDIGNGTMYL
jgi:hypothetical protein